METRYFGKPMKRTEDPRLLTGKALFVDDVELPGMLHVAFARSDFAHGRILGIDVESAREMPGVVAVYTAEDLGDYHRPGPLLVPCPPIEGAVFHPRMQVPLAKDKVRHVGEPLAVVVATSRYIAEDAAEEIFADIEPLDAVIDLEAALEPDSPKIHEDLESNLAAHVVQTKDGGDFDAVAATAHKVIEKRFFYDHGIAAAMENRGVVASWDPRDQQMEIWDTTQAPIAIRNGLAAMLGLAEGQVRVVAPFIGGGFGPKIMMFYPEEVLLPWISMRLEKPVKWIEDRAENFVATTHERGQIHESALAVDENGKILAVRDVFIHDAGAYNPYGLTVPINSQCTLLGPYDVPNYYSEFRAVYTNKTLVTPYRGAGRQHGVFVMERLLDLAARELGLDVVEIRRRNFLPKDAFPHDHGLIYQDFSSLVYDSGDYAPAMDKAVDLIDFGSFQKERPEAGPHKRRGLGIVCYVEGTGIGPYEGARVTVEPTGTVSLVTGVGTQGQGHYTSFAQVVGEQLGVDPTKIRVVTGDTRQFHWGAGTFASRGAVVAGNACHAAALEVRKKILKLASEELEAPEDDLELVDGRVQVKGVPAKALELGALAGLANPMRGAVEPGTEPGLEATTYFGPEHGSTASGVHAMEVEVDLETCDVEIKRYVVVHDCGTVINPLILEGQIQGGVAQGIGNAFYEQILYDDDGQLLNGSFMDYLLPTSMDVPNIVGDHVVTPSPLNPLGIKGAGEAGAIPVGPLFAQAVEDALNGDLGDGGDGERLEILEIPLSPQRIFEIVRDFQARQGNGDAS